MEEKEEQANHIRSPKQPLATQQPNQQPIQHPQQSQPTIQYFIPPPINYLNSQYYKHLESENPMRQLTQKFVCFDEELPVNQTPPDIPMERPITLSLKKELSQRNRDIYTTMLRILANAGRIGAQQSIEGLQVELKGQMERFLEICAAAKVTEIRYLTLRRIQAETAAISQRSKALKSELQQVKAELKGQKSGQRAEE